MGSEVVMSRCDSCFQMFRESDSCDMSLLIYSDSQEFERVKYGNEIRWWSLSDSKLFTDGRCIECNVIAGSYHHENCSSEECPKCMDNLTDCLCIFRKTTDLSCNFIHRELYMLM